jgi:hypothetical protein
MKKFILICFLAVASSMTITSCTDEVIAPNDNPPGNTGGGGSEPLPKP